MRISDPMQICKRLLQTDGEEGVIAILKEIGVWDNRDAWRHYGDLENNWGQSGNQQSLAEAALAEKIVNSVDAQLVNECLIRGIEPRSNEAPSSMRDAVADFFDNGKGGKVATGDVIEEWGREKIRDVAEQITFCTTGQRPSQLNITIADTGEGQSASRLPETIMSLSKSNKMYIPFVQGQFNQGGTGALRFCGHYNLQLVVSRRNQVLLEPDHSPEDKRWCFTVVRRERPERGRKNSVYTYLAPIGVDASLKRRSGGVLTFSADKFGIMPDNDGPYARQVCHGTAIKMYDYAFKGDRSNILRGQSLLSRLELLLPELALPVRFYEYRTDSRGKYLEIGSRATTALGLLRRIKNNENVEKGFPIAIPIQVNGETLIARVYAFVPTGSTRDGITPKKNGARRLGGSRSYRKNEGVLFLRNGQTQGSWTKSFFGRKTVKMKAIADDLLVFIDCDGLSNSIREDLFMPSRDRLVENEFKQSMLKVIEDSLRESAELKLLQNQRLQNRLNELYKEERPLTNVLQSVINNSPNLVRLLQTGERITSPFNTNETRADPKASYQGKVYPTFFKFKGKEYGHAVELERPINRRIRLSFETDAQNEYFVRTEDPGFFELAWVSNMGDERRATFSGPNLRNGIATVTFGFPSKCHYWR